MASRQLRGLVQAMLLLAAATTLHLKSCVADPISPSSTLESHPLAARATDNPDYHCTKSKPCKSGCCGPLDDNGNGICGLGPKFCGTGCTSTCDQKGECDPGWGSQWSTKEACPLNVCCSEYGFCGTTQDFCGDKIVSSPSCSVSQQTANQRIIGYYEGWNYQRACDNMKPADIPLGYYTHINFAFSLIDPDTFRLAAMDSTTGSLYNDVSALKQRDPNLQVWIAIGGWAFNDPGPTRETFSKLAASSSAQAAFFDSLITFLENFGFDGVDIDWEYPAADDRGGSPDDFKNFVAFMAKLRSRLNGSGMQYGVSLTLPSSYWYMQHFDIINLEPHVDFFNMMTYDIHGVWDGNIPSLGAHAQSHTNLTEISLAMDLLWRNNINPHRVNMGLGFYGRSFTMSDPSCMSAGCPFSSAGKAGECTNTPGVLSAGEIDRAIKAGAKVTLDSQAAAQIVTFDGDQWVSFDDSKTLAMKQTWANQHCIGGLMVWAIDLDDGTLIADLFGNTNKTKPLILDPPGPNAECFGYTSDNS